MTTVKDQKTIGVPLDVGNVVMLYEDVDMRDDGSVTTHILFEDTVEQYVPQTGLLLFEESNMGRASFITLVEEAEGYQVVRNT